MAEFATQTLTLLYPVPVPEGEPISTLMMREPDMDAMEKLEELGVFAERKPLLDADGKPRTNEDGEALVEGLKVKEIRQMLGVLGDMPSSLIGKMHPKDFNRIGGLLLPLLRSAGGEGDEPDSNAGTR